MVTVKRRAASSQSASPLGAAPTVKSANKREDEAPRVEVELRLRGKQS